MDKRHSFQVISLFEIKIIKKKKRKRGKSLKLCKLLEGGKVQTTPQWLGRKLYSGRG